VFLTYFSYSCLRR